MPKYPHKDIDAPGPTRGQRQDLTDLKKRIGGTVTFESSKKRKGAGDHDTSAVVMAGTEWAEWSGTPRAQAITLAFRVYWELYDERA